jgi:hypothetical protein
MGNSGILKIENKNTYCLKNAGCFGPFRKYFIDIFNYNSNFDFYILVDEQSLTEFNKRILPFLFEHISSYYGINLQLTTNIDNLKSIENLKDSNGVEVGSFEKIYTNKDIKSYIKIEKNQFDQLGISKDLYIYILYSIIALLRLYYDPASIHTQSIVNNLNKGLPFHISLQLCKYLNMNNYLQCNGESTYSNVLVASGFRPVLLDLTPLKSLKIKNSWEIYNVENRNDSIITVLHEKFKIIHNSRYFMHFILNFFNKLDPTELMLLLSKNYKNFGEFEVFMTKERIKNAFLETAETVKEFPTESVLNNEKFNELFKKQNLV